MPGMQHASTAYAAAPSAMLAGASATSAPAAGMGLGLRLTQHGPTGHMHTTHHAHPGGGDFSSLGGGGLGGAHQGGGGAHMAWPGPGGPSYVAEPGPLTNAAAEGGVQRGVRLMRVGHPGDLYARQVGASYSIAVCAS